MEVFSYHEGIVIYYYVIYYYKSSCEKLGYWLKSVRFNHFLHIQLLPEPGNQT